MPDIPAWKLCTNSKWSFLESVAHLGIGHVFIRNGSCRKTKFRLWYTVMGSASCLFWLHYHNHCDIPAFEQEGHDSVFCITEAIPDRAVHEFRASKPGNQRFWSTQNSSDVAIVRWSKPEAEPDEEETKENASKDTKTKHANRTRGVIINLYILFIYIADSSMYSYLIAYFGSAIG